MARPRLNIDAKQVEQLAAIDCSYEEMGAVLGCSPDTLERRFAGVIQKGRATGRSSLKRKQFTMAMAGNVTMLIWLGKQRLGQSDKQRIENVDLTNATDEQLTRLAAGEDPVLVFARRAA